MDITYCGEKLPCEDELRGLYGSLGWTAYIDDMKSAVSGPMRFAGGIHRMGGR